MVRARARARVRRTRARARMMKRVGATVGAIVKRRMGMRGMMSAKSLAMGSNIAMTTYELRVIEDKSRIYRKLSKVRVASSFIIYKVRVKSSRMK